METKIAKYADSNAFREAMRKRVDETETEIEELRGEVATTLGRVLSAQGIKPAREPKSSREDVLAGELEKEFFMTGYLFVEMARELGFSAYVAGLVSTECSSFSASTLPDADGNTEERTKDGDGVDEQLDEIFYNAAFKQVAEIEHTTATATKKPKVKKAKKTDQSKSTAA